jgi:hypothetical protein
MADGNQVWATGCKDASLNLKPAACKLQKHAIPLRKIIVSLHAWHGNAQTPLTHVEDGHLLLVCLGHSMVSMCMLCCWSTKLSHNLMHAWHAW